MAKAREANSIPQPAITSITEEFWKREDIVVSVEDVTTAYRVIFDRNPTPEEIERQTGDCANFADLRKRLLASGEFQKGILGSVIPLCKPLDWPPMDVEVEVTEQQLQSMIQRMERNFRYMGEHEPHWSVLSADRFRAANIHSSEEEFFASGQEPVDKFRVTVARCGIDITKYTSCFELGCGLGRTTRWLADDFVEVIGADISASHLALARQALTRFGKQNVTLLKVDTMAGFAGCPHFDVFFSLIVLQHNPPPLIAFLLRTLLNKLEPGGLAYFQVPTYRFGYRFNADTYIASELKLGVPEMHVLPQHVVLRIADESGCCPLEVREDPSGSYDLISQRFLLRKSRGTSPAKAD